ncbi:MAG: zinc ribbon domain-containing protein [Gammaproteobacteria bacterium]|nr:zinc ribbon domain-containing protein [Gammaproteobacteria bacterium]
MMILLGAVLVAAAVVLYVVQPVFSGERASLASLDEEFTEAEARRHLSLVALRDVEYDFATGKVDERDYRRLRDELGREALDALREVQRSRDQAEDAPPAKDAVADDLEREIAAYRAALRSGTLCDRCGSANVAEALFCATCGRQLESERGEEAAAARGR